MDSKPSGNIRDSVFVKTYLIGLVLGLVLWPFTGPILAAEVAIAVFWGLQLLMLIMKRVSDQAWVRLVIEFLPPFVLWLLFGFGGVMALLKVQNWDIFSAYEDLTVLYLTIFMLFGSYAYLFGIRIALGDAKLNWENNNSRDVTGIARLLLLVILTVDWLVRIQKNAAGVYVNWVAKSGYFSAIERGTTNALYQLQANIGMIAIPLLVYLSLKDRAKWVFRFLLLFQFTLIFLEGDRSELLIALMVAVSAFGMTKGVRMRRRVIAWAVLALLIFFGLIGPIIQEARGKMQLDVRVLAQERSTMPIRFATVYVPQSLGANIFTMDPGDASLVSRLSSYMSYGAAIYQSNLDGKADLLVDDFWPTIAQLVPRALFPDKGVRSSNLVIQSHFKIGRAGTDAPGTPVTDVFAYLHAPGIVLLMFVCGLGFGLVVKFLTIQQGLLGGLVAIGMIPVLLPVGDSFVSYLAGLRNTVVLLFIIYLVDIVYTIGTRDDKKASESLESLNIS